MAVTKKKKWRDARSLTLIRRQLLRLATAEETRHFGEQQLRLAAYALAKFDFFEDRHIAVKQIAKDMGMKGTTNVSKALTELAKQRILAPRKRRGRNMERRLYRIKKGSGALTARTARSAGRSHAA